LGACSPKKFTADRDRRLVAGGGLDAHLPGEAVCKTLHRRCRRIRCGAVAASAYGTKQLSLSGGGAVLELADDALDDMADGIDRADNFLLADDDIIKQAFQLCCNAGID
jgi:hypothetical protein